MRGTIHDSTNAAVPKAKIRLVNQDTNITRESLASAEGIYYFGDIQPGRYELTVEMAGFKKWVGTMVVEVGQTAVVDPVLEVGSLTSTVEVTSAAPVITRANSGRPTAGATVGQRRRQHRYYLGLAFSMATLDSDLTNRNRR